jgi:NADH dehydrogenase FAD-containing subunit
VRSWTVRGAGSEFVVLALVALQEGATVARNLRATIERGTLEPFKFADKGFVVSIGDRELAGITIGGRLAHGLKDAIECESTADWRPGSPRRSALC